MAKIHFRRLKKQRGALMLEVLISLFFVVTVFAGQLGSQVFMQKSTAEAAQRTHAVSVLGNMADRLASNRAASGCYEITNADGVSPFLGTGGTTAASCVGFGNAATQVVAANDLNAWEQLLLGSSGVNNSGQIANLKNAKGCISVDELSDPPVITIAVAWEGTSEQITPLSNCGKGSYGNESVRRAVQTQLQFGKLSS